MKAEDYVRVRGKVADVTETDSRNRKQQTPVIEQREVKRIDGAKPTHPTTRNFVVCWESLP